jgi:poly(A) polymerase
MVCLLRFIVGVSLTRSLRAGAVESKVRQLVSKLESIDMLARIHPFIKGFDKTYYIINMQEHGDVVLGNVSPTVASRTEEEAKELQTEESQTIYTTTYYIGLEIARATDSAHLSLTPRSELTNHALHFVATNIGPRKLDISLPTSEFMKIAKGWESYQSEIMGIAVRHIKKLAFSPIFFEKSGLLTCLCSSALPDDVFEGAGRPKKVVKRTKAKVC